MQKEKEIIYFPNKLLCMLIFYGKLINFKNRITNHKLIERNMTDNK